MMKLGDRVVIVNKNNIEGEVVGFYKPTQAAVVRTATGNEWIVDPVNLKKTRENK